MSVIPFSVKVTTEQLVITYIAITPHQTVLKTAFVDQAQLLSFSPSYIDHTVVRGWGLRLQHLFHRNSTHHSDSNPLLPLTALENHSLSLFSDLF